MRRLLTIAWYEFLMQVKSLRFKGLVVLIGLFNFALCKEALIKQSFLPRENVLNDEVLKVYLLIIVFAGLFSMGRIRSTGMQPILMTKPFHTITLMGGMLLGALASLVIIMCCILFPVPIVLDFFTNTEVFYRPLFHIILFYLMPAACGVLAITFWVRTCFKNNIMALIIIGGIVFGILMLANSRILNVGNLYHNFTPYVSLFSLLYQRQLDAMQQSPGVSFTDLIAWRHLGMNLLPSAVFLSLACYHLRRSEPQRKVLGNYGSQWYHTPTYLKIVCDLKIDPSITWRSHVATLALIAFIGWAGCTPLISRLPWTQKAIGLVERVKGHHAPTEEPIYMTPGLMFEGGLLPVINHHSRQRLEKEALETDLTFSIEPTDEGTGAKVDLNGRYAELFAFGRERYQNIQMAIDDLDLPHEEYCGNMYIKGEDLQPWADGEKHVLEITARNDQDVIVNDGQNDIIGYSSRGHFFIERYNESQSPIDGMPSFSPEYHNLSRLWPIDLTIVFNEDAQFIEAPVEPTIEQKGRRALFHFALPPSANVINLNIIFAPNGNYSFVEYDRPDIKIKFTIPTNDLEIFNEMLELADPVIQEFCTLKRIHIDEPMLIRFDHRWLYRMVRWTQGVYRKRGRLRHHEENMFYSSLNQFEQQLLDKILFKSFHEQKAYDLLGFLKHNRVKGLNHRVSANHPFESEAHVPVPKGPQLDKPIFQMLYWIMGHETFYDMIETLRERMKTEAINDALIREVATSVSEEPLDEFFNGWLPEQDDDKQKPTMILSYKLLTATADTLTTGPEESTIYKVRAEIQNQGGCRMTVPMRLITTDQPINGRIVIGTGEKVVWEVTSRHLPQSVVVDPDDWIKKFDLWDEELNKRIVTAKLPVTINATE